MEENKPKKERTIRSEVTKVFLVIFGVLSIVGIISIVSAMRGAKTFTTIREVHLKQFQAAEIMKQRALDVISIFYLLATDQEQDVLMSELLRYNPLVESYQESGKLLEKSYANEEGATKDKVLKTLQETNVVFEELNETCRRMLFPMMRGEKADRQHLPKINEGVNKFKAKLDEIETIVSKQLEDESNKAQSLLNFSTIAGITITILAVFITLALIKYLMNFLSVSLLPISNLMHNMRQAVFSVDKNLNVISPVSAYSATVFDQDIVGKNLNEVAFKNIDTSGESFSQHKVAMEVVFGEDEFQWSLVQDGLMRQVPLRPEGGDENSEKILKLSYAPLLEKGLIQNIMVVAEDVTEMEKLRIEGMKKQGKIEIIKGLMGIDTGDLDSFLQTAYDQIKLCFTLLPKLENDLQARQVLFRTLHTLKGNSRMYKLNSVSEAVHTAENYVVTMNQRIQEKEAVGDLPENIRQGIMVVEGILAEHCKMASGFFGIKDYYADYAEAQVRKAVYGLEVMIDEGTIQKKFSEHIPTIESAITASNYFEAPELSEALTQLKTSTDQTPEQWAATVSNVSENYIKMLIKKGTLRPYELDANDWGGFFAKLVELTIGVETKAQDAKLLDIAKSLALSAEKTGLLVAMNCSNDIVEKLSSTSGDKNFHEELHTLWGEFVTVSALDVQKNLEKQGKTPSAVFTKESLKALLSTNNLHARTILSAVFTAMEDLLITIGQFWVIGAKVLKVSPEEAVNLFLGLSSNKGEDNVIYNIRDGLNSQWDQAKDMMKPTVLGPFSTVSKHNSDFKVDVMRLLGTFKAKSGVPLFGAIEQMMKVPSSLLREIHELTEKMSEQEPAELKNTLNDMNKVIQRVHESPLANMFINMTPMVQDLSGRMGKNIEFIIRGDQVYVGRDRANVLRDALVHMIRNTIDHGIETPDDRRAKGKPEKGQLIIDISKSGDDITVSILDDGKGIDVDRLTAKAVKAGFISEEKSASMSHEEKINLVFLPNLSTKEEVTAISGRGVGMDAVRSIVQGFGGKLNIQSTQGQGVSVSIGFTHESGGSVSVKNNMNEAVLYDFFIGMKPMIEELASSLKKEIDYNVTGSDVVVSRERSGALRDALIHLIRNSLDHGFELPTDRSSKGKNTRGQLNINLNHSENEVSVTIKDDGRGVDVEKLTAKAIKLGMISAQQAQSMSYQEKVEMSLLPNLSTKDEVTAISGRGVGMDAVKDIVAGFPGTLSLTSKEGEGFEVKISFKPEPGIGLGSGKK